MPDSSEATHRVLERMLDNLNGQLDVTILDALRELIEAGKFADIDAIEDAVRPREEINANR